MWLAGETEVLGENLPRHHFIHHKSHLTDPGRLGGKPATPATNRFSYGAAYGELNIDINNNMLTKIYPSK
jgi:hypothetical protein